jgi:elongation factor Tu
MSDNELLRSRPHLSVGTIGHFQHGKTTLAAALTRVLEKHHKGINKPLSVLDIAKGGFRRNAHPGWTRILPQSATVEANKLMYESPVRYYGHVDLPGRVEFYKNVASGASQIDAAIVVVSAESSVMPQTREYLLLAKQAGAKQFVVFINKCDLVDDDSMLDLIEEESRLAAAECGVDGNALSVLRGSALKAYEGDPLWEPTVLSLAQAFDTELTQPERLIDAPAMMEIEKVFVRAKDRRVVLGRVARGVIKREQNLQIIGRNIEKKLYGKVRDIEMFYRKIDEARAGDIVGLLMEGKFEADIRRGHIISTPDTTVLRETFWAEATLLTTEEGGRHTPVFDGHRAQFYMGTDNVTGTIRLSGDAIGIAPGQTFTAEISLTRPALLEVGRTFSLRDGCDGLRRLHGGTRAWGGTAGFGVITKVNS